MPWVNGVQCFCLWYSGVLKGDLTHKFFPSNSHWLCVFCFFISNLWWPRDELTNLSLQKVVVFFISTVHCLMLFLNAVCGRSHNHIGIIVTSRVQVSSSLVYSCLYIDEGWQSGFLRSFGFSHEAENNLTIRRQIDGLDFPPFSRIVLASGDSVKRPSPTGQWCRVRPAGWWLSGWVVDPPTVNWPPPSLAAAAATHVCSCYYVALFYGLLNNMLTWFPMHPPPGTAEAAFLKVGSF